MLGVRVVKYKIKNLICLLRLSLYPITTIWCCLIATAIFNVVLGYIMCRVEYNSNLYNILLALVTGITASFVVSVVVELSSNYRSNRLSCYELDEYYHLLINFERSKNVINKFRDDFEEHNIHDIVQFVWQELPKMASLLFHTLEHKKAFLSDDEIKILSSIKSEYDGIKDEICSEMKLPLLHNIMNHPDENCLCNKYPDNILEDSPVWLRKYLATKESEEAVQRLTEVVMSDDFLLNQIMSDYDISIQSMSYCVDNSGDDNNENRQGNTLSCNDMYFDYENMPEDDYKIWCDEVDENLAEERKTFVSWYISNSCYRIAQHIEQLKKHISKKPYVGIFLEIMHEVNEKLPNR